MSRNSFDSYDFLTRRSTNEWVWRPQKHAWVTSVRVAGWNALSIRVGVDVYDVSVMGGPVEARGFVEYVPAAPIRVLCAMEFGVEVPSDVERVVVIAEYEA